MLFLQRTSIPIPVVEKKEKEIVLPKMSDFATEFWWHTFRLLWVTVTQGLPTSDFLKAESQSLIRSCFRQLNSLRLFYFILLMMVSEAVQLGSSEFLEIGKRERLGTLNLTIDPTVLPLCNAHL